MTIRPLGVGEVDELIALWKAFMNDPSAIDGLIPTHEENTKRMAEFVKKQVTDDPNQVLVAEDSGSLVGYLIFQRQAKFPLETDHKWAYISDLYVAPSNRKRGVGGSLLRTCLDHLRSAGVSHIRLNVLSGNQQAMQLYRKAGFKDYMLLMEKRLLLKVLDGTQERRDILSRGWSHLLSRFSTCALEFGRPSLLGDATPEL